MESGNELIDVAFTVDENGCAVIANAEKGYFHVTASGDELATVSAKKRVADINTAQLAKQLLPYIAIIMVVGIALYVALRQRRKKRNTLGYLLSKTSESLGKLIEGGINKDKFVRTMKFCKRALKKRLDEAEMRDHETLGQYQSVCNMLDTAINICEASIKSVDKLGDYEMQRIAGSVKEKYVDKSVNQCNDLDEALACISATKVAAVMTTPQAVQTENHLFKKDKSEQKPDYMEMLTRFYRKGDDDDDDGRDSDRNDDSETEN